MLRYFCSADVNKLQFKGYLEHVKSMSWLAERKNVSDLNWNYSYKKNWEKALR